MATKSSKSAKMQKEHVNRSICDCTDCFWAHLVQYEGPREPLLAECTKKPQPYSVRFPYQVEVARTKKVCPMYLHTDEVRTPEIRAKVRFNPTACNVYHSSGKAV